MNPRHAIADRHGIISLMTVFAIGFVVLALALAALASALLELDKTQNAYLTDRSFYASESGMAEGAYQLTHTTSSISLVPFQLLNTVSAGSIQITTTSFYTTITGVAANQTERKTYEVFTTVPGIEAFKYAMFGVGDVSMTGNNTINGSVLSNGKIDLTGNASINGDAYWFTAPAPPAGKVSGIDVQSLATTTAPKIDDAPYKAMAQAGGTLFTTSTVAAAYLQSNPPAGVVVYVSSTNAMTLNTNFIGTLVTLGDLDLKGSYQNATTSQPVIITRGNLSTGANVTINGAIFVKGNTSLGGGTTLAGTIISEGTINGGNGNVSITFDPSLYSNWQNIVGLATSTASSTPTLLYWSEN